MFGLSGKYVFVKYNKHNVINHISESLNVITDLGLDLIGTGGISHYCHLGSGNTLPTVGDTSLESHLGTVYRTASQGNTLENGDIAKIRGGWRYRFPPGNATGIISEVGISRTNSGGTQLFSRSLIKDDNGDPTSIEKLADEYLDVYYFLIMHVDTRDKLFTTEFKGITRNGIIRPANLQNFNISGNGIGENGFTFGGTYGYIYGNGSVLGNVLSSPSGNSRSSDNYGNSEPYVGGSHERIFKCFFDIENQPTGNQVNNFLYSTYNSGCSFKASFDPPLEKPVGERIDFAFKVKWGRV